MVGTVLCRPRQGRPVAAERQAQLDPDGLLDTPISDAAGVAKWTDSIFNAGVPLHQGFHTGVLSATGAPGAAAPAGASGAAAPGAAAPGAAAPTSAPGAAAPTTQQPGGVHNYPTPIADIQLFKYDDFQLWVTDAQGNPAAVAPVAKRGSGNASVHVLYATPGSQLDQQKQAAEQASQPLILGPGHSLSIQAYQRQ
jgi:hypothetical protein